MQGLRFFANEELIFVIVQVQKICRCKIAPRLSECNELDIARKVENLKRLDHLASNELEIRANVARVRIESK